MESARRRRETLQDFLHSEAAGGIALVAAAATALALANSPLSDVVASFWGQYVTLGWGPTGITEDLRHWVNDGLMAIFFFVVGLEIKRELAVGELSEPRAAALPVAAALGGVILPATIFLLIAPEAAHDGWGIPMATDIAFAVGILALLGDRVPTGAKLLLLSAAIVDDIIAIVVIAVFYTETIRWSWLVGSLAALGLVLVMQRLNITAIWPYALVGMVTWITTLESGVHATIAGVALGLLTPTGDVGGRSVLDVLERRLHPWSAFVIVPLFALANVGIDFRGGLLSQAATNALTWAIVLGLVVGKFVGITAAVWLCLRTGLGRLPTGVAAAHVAAVAAVAGVGFTVSLFISDLAYEDASLVDAAKVGIFGGSLIAGMVGTVLMLLATRARTGPGSPETRAGGAAAA